MAGISMSMGIRRAGFPPPPPELNRIFDYEEYLVNAKFPVLHLASLMKKEIT